jgi:hypothetical protein
MVARGNINKSGGIMRFIALLLTIVSFSLYAQTALDSNSFLEIEKTVLEKGKKYGKDQVLVVLDIDNTVLQMNGNFGSDQWWNWQSKGLNVKKCDYCVAKNFGELLDIQGQIFAMAEMSPTEKVTPKVVQRLQNSGYKVILLTSRGPDFRNATMRALKRNDYNMTRSAIGPKGGYASTYLPYTLSNLKQFGLNTEDAKISSLKKARKVSFQDGVFMTAGLNKGIMLKTLLHKTGTNFKAIIFADDHKKHTVRVQQILGRDKNIDVTTFRYGAIDGTVKKFWDGNKKDSKKAWAKFNQVRQLLQ